jgi:hypothetical protein
MKDVVPWNRFTSIADLNNWRFINVCAHVPPLCASANYTSRESSSPLMYMLSAMHGYENVNIFFVQAVPTLSNYIELPPTREIKV